MRFRKAVEDLSMIWNYTYETWSEKQADIYYHLLIDSCEEIASCFTKRFKNMKY